MLMPLYYASQKSEIKDILILFNLPQEPFHYDDVMSYLVPWALSMFVRRLGDGSLSPLFKS